MSCEIDARVDGRWRAWFRRGDGGEVYAGGTYLEIAPPSRVVFTWDIDPAGSAAGTLSVVSVVLHETQGGTAIEISHRKLGTARAVDMDAGWNNTLDALEESSRRGNGIAGGRHYMTETTYTGGCACGAIHYEIAAEPAMAGICQCRDCQRAAEPGIRPTWRFPWMR